MEASELLYRFFSAFWIIAGLFLISKYAWMIIYQIKYGGDAGMVYLREGRKAFKK